MFHKHLPPKFTWTHTDMDIQNSWKHILLSKIGVPWGRIWYTKSAIRSLNERYSLQYMYIYIFQVRYCASLQAKGLQSCQVSRFEIRKKSDIFNSRLILLCDCALYVCQAKIFFQTSKFDIWQFGSFLSCRN